MLVQAFVAETPVQALDKGVLHGLARRDVMPADAAVLLPAQDRMRRQLGSVVGHDRQRLAAPGYKRIQFARDAAPADRALCACCDAEPSAVPRDTAETASCGSPRPRRAAAEYVTADSRTGVAAGLGVFFLQSALLPQGSLPINLGVFGGVIALSSNHRPDVDRETARRHHGGYFAGCRWPVHDLHPATGWSRSCPSIRGGSSLRNGWCCATSASAFAANQGRLSLHHPLRRVRQGSQRARALHPRHQRGDRRPDRRRGRDRRFDGQLIMPKFVIGELQAVADSSDRLPPPRPARARYPQPAPQQHEHRTGDLRARSARIRRAVGRSEAGGAGQTSQGQADHQRLQPQQGGPAAGRRGHQSERSGQLAEAGVPAGRADRGPRRQGRRGARPGHRLSGRRHDGRHRIGPRPRQSDVAVAVTSVLQTSAGRMVFGKVEK